MILDILVDVVGVNDAGRECHPFKGIRGPKKGFYSYTLSANNKTFKPITDAELRRRIEAGEFNRGGRVRMVPVGAKSTASAGALAVIRYKGKKLPL